MTKTMSGSQKKLVSYIMMYVSERIWLSVHAERSSSQSLDSSKLYHDREIYSVLVRNVLTI